MMRGSAIGYVEGSDAFDEACRNGDLSYIRSIELSSSSPIDFYNLANNGILFACKNGQFEIVQYIVQKFPPKRVYGGIECMLKYMNGFNEACIAGHLAIVKLMFQNHDIFVFNAFENACAYGHLPIVKYIFEVFEGKERDDEKEMVASFALGCACRHNQIDIARFLVSEFGSNIAYSKTFELHIYDQPFTPFEITCNNGFVKLFIILSKGDEKMIHQEYDVLITLLHSFMYFPKYIEENTKEVWMNELFDANMGYLIAEFLW
jgi:hypothetical protein